MKAPVPRRVQIDMLYGTDEPFGPRGAIEPKFNKLVLAVQQIQNILIQEGKLKP